MGPCAGLNKDYMKDLKNFMEVEVGVHASAKDLFTQGKTLPFGAEPGQMSIGIPGTTAFKDALGSSTGAKMSGFGFNTLCTDTSTGSYAPARFIKARWVRSFQRFSCAPWIAP